MSTPAPRPAPQEAVLRQPANLGRRHSVAAVYWQIGDSGSDAAQEFYRSLLAGIAGADPGITSLYQMPGLTAEQDYDRDNLAADLGLAPDDPALAQAAQAYLAAAREEFWLEAARLARRRLHPGPDHGADDADDAGTATSEPRAEAAVANAEDEGGAEAESAGVAQDITDPGHRTEQAAGRTLLDLHPSVRRQDAPRAGTDSRVRPASPGRRDVRGLPSDSDLRGQSGLRPGDLPGFFRCLRRPLAGAAPAARLRPPDRGRPAAAGRTRRRTGPVTRAEAVAHLRTLGTVAVWNLAVPAVIRPCRDGWLIFLPGEGHAWYGTAEAGRTRCSPESTAVAYRPDSADQALCDKGLVPVLRARAVTCQRSRPPAPRACTATPSRWPRRRHGPVTRPSVW